MTTTLESPAPASPSTRPPALVRPDAPSQRHRPRWLTFLLRCVGPLALLGLWWVGSETGFFSPKFIASPEQVVSQFSDLVASGELQHHVGVSLDRALRGLIIGGSIGLIAGIVAGLSTLGEELLDPAMQMLRTVPFIALIPLFIVWFGIGETSKVALIALACAFPMYLNAYSGVRNVDPKLVEAARVFGLKKARLVREIVLPAALPSIMTGLRYAMGISILALIAAEQINSSAGIGYLATKAREFLQTDVLLVCILVYAMLGLAADLIVRVLERTSMPWLRSQRGVK
jgi:sulfonate transport system permease protein